MRVFNAPFDHAPCALAPGGFFVGCAGSVGAVCTVLAISQDLAGRGCFWLDMVAKEKI